jgi:hypothetical protein
MLPFPAHRGGAAILFIALLICSDRKRIEKNLQIGCRRMDKGYLILKRASTSRSSGEWNDDDYDVLANGVVVGRILKVNGAPAMPWSVDPRTLWASRGSHANSRVCRDARGRDGGLCKELAAGVGGPLAASGSVKQLRRWTSVPKPPDP